MRGVALVLCAIQPRAVAGWRAGVAHRAILYAQSRPSAPGQPSTARARAALAEHVVQAVIAPRAGVLLRSWQKQAEDNWSQGFTPTSTMDGMRCLSAQVKQLQRMAALARIMSVRSQSEAADDSALPTLDSHFAPYLSRMPHISILAAVAPGNGTAIAFSTSMPDTAELLHVEASPVCNKEHAGNAKAALLDVFLARAADALPATATVVADACPGSQFAALLLERGFAEEDGVGGWMPDSVRYTRAVARGGP